MIIDFHTHLFPDTMAQRVIQKLSLSSNSYHYSDGTQGGLLTSMKEAGVDLSVVLPVATKPTQSQMLNRNAIEMNEKTNETNLLFFGSIHPQNQDYKELIDELANNGVKGIKIHPVFCGVSIDDISFERIISYASDKGLIVLTHAGFDIGFPGETYVAVEKIEKMLSEVAPEKMVLAHMGGWAEWDKVYERLCGRNVWLDTSFSITPLRESAFSYSEDMVKLPHTEKEQLSKQLFCDMVLKHGDNRILFGTDSPWSSQKEAISCLKESGLSNSQLNNILGENAKALLKL